MRKESILIYFLFVLALFSCSSEKKEASVIEDNKIHVGIFDTNGDSPGCITDAYEALRIDGGIDAKIIGAPVIMSRDIMNYDLILFPGGSGRAETNRLGELGRERVRDLVINHGKAVLGICAGSYILTQTDSYPSLGLSGVKAIDIEHDHRGHGLVKFSLTPEGQELFPELKDREISFSKYYEGPVLTTADNPQFSCTSLATMLSDVHTVEGTPANMTNNRPFITATKAGKGSVVTFVGHPENTPGMRWMIPRMVRWAVGSELVAYSEKVMRPELYSKEILFSKELLEKQSRFYDHLWTTEAEKLEAIQELVNISSWSAKKWIIGMLRDSSPKVRAQAAQALLQLERTDALEDVKIAYEMETDVTSKEVIKKCLKNLEAMIGCEMK